MSKQDRRDSEALVDILTVLSEKDYIHSVYKMKDERESQFPILLYKWANFLFNFFIIYDVRLALDSLGCGFTE